MDNKFLLELKERLGDGRLFNVIKGVDKYFEGTVDDFFIKYPANELIKYRGLGKGCLSKLLKAINNEKASPMLSLIEQIKIHMDSIDSSQRKIKEIIRKAEFEVFSHPIVNDKIE